MRKLAVLVIAAVALILAPAANAAITSVMDGDLSCGEVTVEGNVAGSLGQRWCGSKPNTVTSTLDTALPMDRSTIKTFDGVPLDVNVAFPPDPAPAADGPWPVVGMYHGYGGSKSSFPAMQRWLNKGYAVFSLTNRGSGESCASQDSIDADPAGCANGYVRLMDVRYEIRDAQLFLGKLVDDGVVEPDKIAATGSSYGGSESMQLAVLKDRQMNLDGSLEPWKSPDGTAMSLAVASPNIPWTDLIQSLAPNGDTLDYLRDGSYDGKPGIMKESYLEFLFFSARNAPAGVDPRADLVNWKALLDAGEPYAGAAYSAMVDEITEFHSSYYTNHDQAPAPLLMSSGFTDDLFPVDEVVRFYNRTRAQYPNTPMSIFAGSFGHPRGQFQANVLSALRDLEDSWVDHYLMGVGPQPESNVTAYTQTCPNGSPGTGPYTAGDWASLAPGEIRLSDQSAARTIAADSGNSDVAGIFNPLSLAGACATASDAIEIGTLTYDLDPAPSGGYTVMGSATVIAKISVANGPDSQVAARLVDLDGAGNKTLVARGTWRPDPSGFQVFQLHPGAWKVEAGHRLRLELLSKDAKDPPPGGAANYARPSNGQQPVTVEKLELRIPVLEEPGSLGGLVEAPARKVLPARDDAALAPGYEAIGSQTLAEYASQFGPGPGPGPKVGGAWEVKGRPKAKGRKLRVRVACSTDLAFCEKANLIFLAKPKKGRKFMLAKRRGVSVAAGETKRVKMKLTRKARRLFKNRRVVVRKKGKKRVRRVKGQRRVRTVILIDRERAGQTVTKRKGRVR